MPEIKHYKPDNLRKDDLFAMRVSKNFNKLLDELAEKAGESRQQYVQHFIVNNLWERVEGMIKNMALLEARVEAAGEQLADLEKARSTKRKIAKSDQEKEPTALDMLRAARQDSLRFHQYGQDEASLARLKELGLPKTASLIEGKTPEEILMLLRSPFHRQLVQEEISAAKRKKLLEE